MGEPRPTHKCIAFVLHVRRFRKYFIPNTAPDFHGNMYPQSGIFSKWLSRWFAGRLNRKDLQVVHEQDYCFAIINIIPTHRKGVERQDTKREWRQRRTWPWFDSGKISWGQKFVGRGMGWNTAHKLHINHTTDAFWERLGRTSKIIQSGPGEDAFLKQESECWPPRGMLRPSISSSDCEMCVASKLN
jgi:hypothetical protein